MHILVADPLRANFEEIPEGSATVVNIGQHMNIVVTVIVVGSGSNLVEIWECQGETPDWVAPLLVVSIEDTPGSIGVARCDVHFEFLVLSEGWLRFCLKGQERLYHYRRD